MFLGRDTIRHGQGLLKKIVGTDKQGKRMKCCNILVGCSQSGDVNEAFECFCEKTEGICLSVLLRIGKGQSVQAVITINHRSISGELGRFTPPEEETRVCDGAVNPFHGTEAWRGGGLLTEFSKKEKKLCQPRTEKPMWVLYNYYLLS